jgi:FkbM family methyltransferase
VRAAAARHAVREEVARALRALPAFRGKGRITLLLDRLLTDYRDEASYLADGPVNGRAILRYDLRSFGQRFGFYHGGQEPELVAALAGLYAGGTFVDVGSSLALYLVCLGPLVRARGGTMLSFEPVPANLERQRINLELNGLADLVETVPCALGARAGSLRMLVDPTGADNNAFGSPEGTLEVPMTTLDQVLGERPALRPVGAIKMDVEGYEPEVVAGACGVIAADRPVILAEFNRERMAINGSSIEPSWEFLRGEGYRAWRVGARGLVPLDRPGADENILFVPAHRGERGCAVAGPGGAGS